MYHLKKGYFIVVINCLFLFREKRDEDYEYDHEAFLGAEDAHEFDDLDPEESKVRTLSCT